MATNTYLRPGTPVVAEAILKRELGHTRNGWQKVWQRVEVPLTGQVVSVRTLSKRDSLYMDEDGIVYYPDKRLNAYLIGAWDSQRSLVLALVEDVTKVEVEHG